MGPRTKRINKGRKMATYSDEDLGKDMIVAWGFMLTLDSRSLMSSAGRSAMLFIWSLDEEAKEREMLRTPPRQEAKERNSRKVPEIVEVAMHLGHK